MPFSLKRLLAVVAAVAAGLYLWDTPFVYPLKLLVVFMHECGHALATVAVGGSVEKIVIDPREGGLCLSRYSPGFFRQVAISSAGYLGSALSGASLLYLTLRFGSGRRVLFAVSAFVVLCSVLWARDLFTFLVAVALAALLSLCARFLPEDLSRLVAFFVAVFNGLYVLFDVRDDLWDSSRRIQSDAAILASHTVVPSIVWAVAWSVIAVAMLGAAVTFGARAGKK